LNPKIVKKFNGFMDDLLVDFQKLKMFLFHQNPQLVFK